MENLLELKWSNPGCVTDGEDLKAAVDVRGHPEITSPITAMQPPLG